MNETISVIESNRSWLHFDWKGLLQYRDLLFLMVRRDFVSKYKQTVLGPVWFIFQPLATALVFIFVFSTSLKIPTSGVPPILFYLCGLLIWSYLSQCLNATSMSLIVNSQLFKKVYFPRLIVPLSQTLSFLLTFGIQFAVFLLFYFYFKFFTKAGATLHVTSYLWVLPLFVLQVAALSLGLGLWVASLTVHYRDFHHLMGFFATLWMYATPISYPMDLIPEQWRIVVALNPIAPTIEVFREAFFGVGTVSWSLTALSWGVTALVLVTGILCFNRIERTFIDKI